MIGYPKVLADVEKEKYVNGIIWARWQYHPVKRTYNVSLDHSNGKIKVFKVLYAWEVKKNILSIRSFVKEVYIVVYNDLNIVLSNNKIRKSLVIATLDGKENLWKLKTTEII